MLELRPTCENCITPLPPNFTEAMICTFECTFCRRCVEDLLKSVCPKRRFNKQNLAQSKKMDELAPAVRKAFWAFDKAAVAEGSIPVKYKELIAVGVALTTQCPYCIAIYTGKARKAGANDTGLTAAAMVAAALRAGEEFPESDRGRQSVRAARWPAASRRRASSRFGQR